MDMYTAEKFVRFCFHVIRFYVLFFSFFRSLVMIAVHKFENLSFQKFENPKIRKKIQKFERITNQLIINN